MTYIWTTAGLVEYGQPPIMKMCCNCSHYYSYSVGMPDHDGVCRMGRTVVRCDAYPDRPEVTADYHCDRWREQDGD